jgi:hypothetical protein
MNRTHLRQAKPVAGQQLPTSLRRGPRNFDVRQCELLTRRDVPQRAHMHPPRDEDLHTIWPAQTRWLRSVTDRLRAVWPALHECNAHGQPHSEQLQGSLHGGNAATMSRRALVGLPLFDGIVYSLEATQGPLRIRLSALTKSIPS